MKSRPSIRTLLSSLLCMGLLTSAAPAANPLKAIGSGIKKVGSALTPWKKKEAPESPAPVAKPAAPKPAAGAKPAAAKTANKKTVASRAPAKPRKSSAGDSTESHSTTKRKGANGTTTDVGEARSKTDSKNKKQDRSSGDTKETPSDSAAPAEADANVAANAPEAKPAPIPLADLPFGTPVMGKRGYVRSPYAEDQGMVDVTDIPAGTKVKCPFSGKIFRVP